MGSSWEGYEQGSIATRIHQDSFKSLPDLRERRDERDRYPNLPAYISLPYLDSTTGYKNQGYEVENGECLRGGDEVYGERHLSEKKEPSQADEAPDTLAENFLGFTQYTSFHGVHFMWELGTFGFRRVLWFILFFGSLSILLYQISDRVIYLASAPVMVKVEVNFNKTIRFPSVALCNQNSYRITRAAALNRIDLIKQIYTPKGNKKFNITEILANHTALSLTEKELLLKLGHTREDMIVSCRWDGQKCGPEDFEMQFTDHGLCYIFNGFGKNPEKYVKNTGINAGLRLLLNTENYESMTGPHESSGLKFLLYDRKDIPLVFEMGLGMPTGNHAFIGLSLHVMVRLPQPYGNCTKSNRLKYFNYYTQMACKRQCWTDYFVKRCGCLLPYMMADGIPDCRKEVAWLCEKKTRMEFEENAEACSCQPGCRTLFYQPNLSYLKSAKADVFKLFQIANKTKLQEKYSRARDTVTATSKELLQQDAGILNALNMRGDVLNDVMRKYLPEAIARSEKHLFDLERAYESVFEAINEVYRFQTFVIDWHFYRAVVSKYRSYFTAVTNMFRELISDAYRKFERITSEKDLQLKRALQAILDDRFAVRSSLSKDAKTQLDLVVKNYAEATAMDTRKYKDIYPEDQHKMIVPKSLLKRAVTEPPRKKLLNATVKNLETLQKTYTNLGKFLTKVFFEEETYKRGNFQTERVEPYEAVATTYDGNLALLMTEIFHFPLAEIQRSIAESMAKQSGIRKVMDEMQNTIVNIKKELQAIQLVYEGVHSTVTGALDMIKDEKRGKTAVSKAFTDVNFLAKLNKLRRFFASLKSQNSVIQMGYNKLDSMFTGMIDLITGYDDLKAYFAKYQPLFKDTDSITKALMYDKLDEYKSIDELSPVYGRNDTLFFDAMELVQADMKAYLHANKLDEAYYSSNFISMDIFFRELYYQMVSQEKAYTVISLLSDIGGSMGLYIGASILSIFEIFDMLLFYCYRKKMSKGQKSKPEEMQENKKENPPQYDDLVDRRARPQIRETSLTAADMSSLQRARPRRPNSSDRYIEPVPIMMQREPSRSPSRRPRQPREEDRRRKARRTPDGQRKPRKPRKPTDQRKLLEGSSSVEGNTPTPTQPAIEPRYPESPRHSSPRNQSEADDSYSEPTQDRVAPDRLAPGSPTRRGADGLPDITPKRPFYSSSNRSSHKPSSPDHSKPLSAALPPKSRSPSPNKRREKQPSSNESPLFTSINPFV